MIAKDLDQPAYKVWLRSTSRKGPMVGAHFALTWGAWRSFIRLSADFESDSFAKRTTWDLLCHGGRVCRSDAKRMARAMGRAASVVDVDPWFDSLRVFLSEGGFTASVNH